MKKLTFSQRLWCVILRYGVLRYIPLGKSKGFFLFHNPEVNVRGGQKREKAKFPEIAPHECAIYPKNSTKIYLRWQGSTVEEYLFRYQKEIDKSPKFLLSHAMAKFDKNFKIVSKMYLSPIRKLVREVSLLEENRRGGRKGSSDIMAWRNEQILSAYNQYIGRCGKPRRLPIKELRATVERVVGNRFPEESMAEKYYPSESTIRRVLANLMSNLS